jgi:hypothetical protein
MNSTSSGFEGGVQAVERLTRMKKRRIVPTSFLLWRCIRPPCISTSILLFAIRIVVQTERRRKSRLTRRIIPDRARQIRRMFADLLARSAERRGLAPLKSCHGRNRTPRRRYRDPGLKGPAGCRGTSEVDPLCPSRSMQALGHSERGSRPASRERHDATLSR